MNLPENVQPLLGIVPTVLIPLTFVSVGLSIAATFIAGLFGIKLQAEGPKRLLELLLKPKILLGALAMNLLIFLGVKAYYYTITLPAFMWRIESANPEFILQPSRLYADRHETVNVWPELFSLVPQTISPHWTQVLPKGAFRDPLLSGESLFIGSDDGNVYELNKNDGKVLRKFFVGTAVSASPSIHRNALFVGEGNHDTHGARIYKFDLHSSKLLGTFTTGGHIEAQPIFADEAYDSLMLVAAGADGLYAVDPVNLKARWHQKDGHIDSEVQIAAGRVFVGSGREKFDAKAGLPYALAYDLRTGDRLWKRELPASSWMRPVLVGKDVCFTTGELYYKSELGGLSCFDQASGNPSIMINVQQVVTSVPLAIGPVVYIVDVHSRVCALDTRTGLSTWCQALPVEDFSYSSAIYDVTSGMLIVAHKTKGLYGLNPQNGNIILHEKPKDWTKTYGSVATDGKQWFIVDKIGLVRAFTTKPLE